MTTSPRRNAEMEPVEAEEMRLATTRSPSDAPLPVRYEAARAAIAACADLDECMTWADKAAALASYARQSADRELEDAARRIRARAIRRCGELLSSIPAKAHGREVEGRVPTSHPSERALAAKSAGLSPDQTKDALRVARIPEREFEDQVEGPNPPTVTKLAERGTEKQVKPLVDIQGRDPAAYNRALLIRGSLEDLAKMIADVDPDEFLAGCLPRHHESLYRSARRLSQWIAAIMEKAG